MPVPIVDACLRKTTISLDGGARNALKPYEAYAAYAARVSEF